MDVRQFLERSVEQYLFADLDNMANVNVPGAGNCGYPMVMATLAGMELLGALTFPHVFKYDEDNKHFVWYWKHFLVRTAPCYDVKGGIAGVVRTLIRNGLMHGFLAKPGIEVRKVAPSMHMKSAGPETLVIDCTQFAADLRQSYETRVLPILRGKPLTVKSYTISPKSMQEQFDLMTQHYSQEAKDCFNSVHGSIPVLPASQLGDAVASVNFPSTITVTVRNLTSKSFE